jgi:hypothetical protein
MIKLLTLAWVVLAVSTVVEAHVEEVQVMLLDKAFQEGDTINQWEPKDLGPLKLIMGGRFLTGENSNIQIISPILTLNYNTIEGFNTTYGIRYNRLLSTNSIFSIGPDVRFSVPRNKVTGIISIGYQYQEHLSSRSIEIQGGRGIRQFNADIAPFSNTIMTLLFQKNDLKLFEQDFINLGTSHNFHEIFRLGLDIEHSDRWELFNLPRLVEGREHLFTSNAPENIAIEDTSFPRHNAFIASLSVQFKPWLRYTEVNGKRQPLDESSPTFSIVYEKGFRGIFRSGVDFDNITFGIDHIVNFDISSMLNLNLEAGMFLNTNMLYFMDFFHFPRNQAPFLLVDHDKTFRLLPYYYFSTPDWYFKSNFDHQMQRFLLTRFPLLQVMGIKETLILNNLFTPDMDHYTEFGYGLDYIFRAVRIELITSFLNGRFDGFGVRIGLKGDLEF